MKSRAARQGQPLFLLAGVIIGWTGLRIALWQPAEEAAPIRSGTTPVAIEANGGGNGKRRVIETGAGQTQPDRPSPQAPPDREAPLRGLEPIVPQYRHPVVPAPLPLQMPFGAGHGIELAPPPQAAAAQAKLPARAVVGHNLLLAAGLSNMEIPASLLAYIQPPAQPAEPAVAPVAARPVRVVSSRWSADGWLMLRNDTISPIQPGLPSYGRSQAGAVVRYQLAPTTGQRPQAYVRASSAITGEPDREIALGGSSRIVPAIPVRVAAEVRLGNSANGTRIRPSVNVITELPLVSLPLGTRGEIYLQGGYVGGADSTYFLEGQSRIDREFAAVGEMRASAGAGAWGGAQKGVKRFDVGPTAAMTFSVGETRGRLSADYRIRVAGDAEPKSGPALTLSAGF